MNDRGAWLTVAALIAAAGSPAIAAEGAGDGRLRGEARTELRRPVVGATVLAVREQAPPVLALTATDANGFLGLDDVPTGDYSILIAAPGFAPGRIDALAVGGPFRAVADVVMREGVMDLPVLDLAAGTGSSSVSLSVVDADGAPLESVRVRLDPVGHRHDPLHTLSDAEGRARVGGLGAGLWRLTIGRAGWTRLRVPAIRWRGGEAMLIARLLPLPGAVRPIAAELIPPPQFLPPAGTLDIPALVEPAGDASVDATPDGTANAAADAAAAAPPDSDLR
ncbi:MAG: carboxypeptidase-like regulatory domain-containing protein [Acidobacteriota bacterium]|nr:carboxypeptidase-like regulatory domain-containing protein [Acidobacteriota bacterium]